MTGWVYQNLNRIGRHIGWIAVVFGTIAFGGKHLHGKLVLQESNLSQARSVHGQAAGEVESDSPSSPGATDPIQQTGNFAGEDSSGIGSEKSGGKNDSLEKEAIENDDQDDDEESDLFDMDLEELGQVDASPPPRQSADPVFEAESMQSEVMSVDGTKSTVGQSPAAVYVLTREMIIRSGVRNVPDALRLVPGVQVSRLNSQLTSVTIRGFAGTFNNKVLVQVDGRIVYSPSYSGVFWDIQDLILDDIERIEIIRGPGATVWGENAVNGVINIITRPAEDTIGTFFEAGAGEEENEFYSFSLGRRQGNLNYRIYGKYAERNPGLNLFPRPDEGFSGEDGGFFGRYGLRADYLPNADDRITTFIDFHRGGGMPVFRQETFVGDFPQQFFNTSGMYAMIQWHRSVDQNRDLNFQTHYDRTNRDWIGTQEKQDNFEMSLRYRNQLSPRRERVSGMTGRYSKGRYFGRSFELDPFTFDLNLTDPYQQLDRLGISYAGGFVQEKWTLIEDKWFSWLGTKVGWNSLNGVNVQPSARTLFVINDDSVVWGAVSRAVRLPTRFDAGIQLEDPDVNFFEVPRTPDDELISESVIAYELGYRRQFGKRLSCELTGFYNSYKDLVEEGPLVSFFGVGPTGQLFRSDGHAYGAELNGEYNLADWCRIRAGCSYLNLEIEEDPTFFQFTALRSGYSPDYMAYLQTNSQISSRLQWDCSLRYVGELPDQFVLGFVDTIPVESYLQVDTRINFQVTRNLDLTVVGRN
ncbi:MAG: TonB-dependent receptor, partial [Planctomycetota bacterium]